MTRHHLVALSSSGRRVGQDHPNAKLSDHDVALMRALHEDGMSPSMIAEKFECSRQTVHAIVTYARRDALVARYAVAGRRRRRVRS